MSRNSERGGRYFATCLASVWLFYLYYPIVYVIYADEPWWWRCAGLVLIVAFVVVYLTVWNQPGDLLSPEGKRQQAIRVVVLFLLVGAIFFTAP